MNRALLSASAGVVAASVVAGAIFAGGSATAETLITPGGPAAHSQTTAETTNRSIHPTASPGTDFYTNGVRLRARPGFHTTVNGIGYRGDRITQLGYRTINNLKYYCHKNRHWDPYWMKVRDRRTGVTGWTPECFINLRPGGTVGAG